MDLDGTLPAIRFHDQHIILYTVNDPTDTSGQKGSIFHRDTSLQEDIPSIEIRRVCLALPCTDQDPVVLFQIQALHDIRAVLFSIVTELHFFIMVDRNKDFSGIYRFYGCYAPAYD